MVASGDQRYLIRGERPVAADRRHWVHLVRPLAAAGGLLVAALVVASVVPPRGLLPSLPVFAAIGSVLYAGWTVAEWRVDRLIITDRRVLLVTGLLMRRVAMMPLVKVTDMTYERSLLGRLLGFGTFVLESAGQQQALHRIGHLRAPDHLYHAVSEQVFGGTQPPEAAVVNPMVVNPMEEAPTTRVIRLPGGEDDRRRDD